MSVFLAASSLPAHADETAPPARFEESGFLKSLDYLIARQNRNPQDKSGNDLRLSASVERDPIFSIEGFRHAQPEGDAPALRKRQNQETTEGRKGTYLYLRDLSDPSNSSDQTAANLPDFSSLLSPTGETRPSQANAFAGRMSALGLVLGADGTVGSGVDLVLQSGYRLFDPNHQRPNPLGVHQSFDAADYSVGLSLGYAGLKLDANLQQQTTLFDSGLSGYGFGFAYQSSRWSARLAWNAYREGTDLLGLENEEREFISVELGANLKLSERINISGGVRHYDYSDHRIVSLDQSGRSQMIFVGGSLRF